MRRRQQREHSFFLLLFSAAVVVVLNSLGAGASEFAPHLLAPGDFEGWYLRLSWFVGEEPRSLGLIFGHYYTNDDSELNNVSLVSVLMDDGGPLKVTSQLSTRGDEVRVTVDNSSVAKDPSKIAPPVFEYRAPGFHFASHADGSQTARYTMDLDVSFAEPRPWGVVGPEGVVAPKLKKKLQWFVYSLGSKAHFAGKEEVQATAHMEKNWGWAFPEAWLWAQGATPETQLVASGGPLLTKNSEGVFILGLRHKGIVDWSFRPPWARFESSHDACAGSWNLTAISRSRRLSVTLRADPLSFGRVQCPTASGFRPTSVESYRATAHVVAREEGLLLDVTFAGFALEFGGTYAPRSTTGSCDHDQPRLLL